MAATANGRMPIQNLRAKIGLPLGALGLLTVQGDYYGWRVRKRMFFLATRRAVHFFTREEVEAFITPLRKRRGRRR